MVSDQFRQIKPDPPFLIRNGFREYKDIVKGVTFSLLHRQL